MNLGISAEQKSVFSNVIPMVRPLVETQTIDHPDWLAGFVSAKGSFFIAIQKYATHNLNERVRLIFKITQHSRDEKLMKSLIEYFNCGNIYNRGEALDFKVTKFDDIYFKIIPFFKKYPIRGGGVKA